VCVCVCVCARACMPLFIFLSMTNNFRTFILATLFFFKDVVKSFSVLLKPLISVTFIYSTRSENSVKCPVLCMFSMNLAQPIFHILPKYYEQLTGVLFLTHTIRMLAEWCMWSQKHQLTLIIWMVMGILTSHTPPMSHHSL
jgi:hypothetical protein